VQQNTAQNASDPATAPTNSATQPAQVAASQKSAVEKGAAEKLTAEKASEKISPEKIPTAVAGSEKTEVVAPKKLAQAKTEPVLSAKAAQMKQKIDDALADRGLTGKASVQGVGNTLTISGKLRPGQHAALLNLLHDVPAGVKIVDNIGDDSSAPAVTSASPARPSAAAGLTSAAPATPNAGSETRSSNSPTPSSVPTAGSDGPKATGSRVAWADVKSFPVGAEIYVDDFPTGKSTPARVQLPSGAHVVTLHLEGFTDVRRKVEVSDGGTIQVSGQLQRNK
jgi:hypothetical protein